MGAFQDRWSGVSCHHKMCPSHFFEYNLAIQLLELCAQVQSYSKKFVGNSSLSMAVAQLILLSFAEEMLLCWKDPAGRLSSFVFDLISVKHHLQRLQKPESQILQRMTKVKTGVVPLWKTLL